jgi:hypothetical protein
MRSALRKVKGAAALTDASTSTRRVESAAANFSLQFSPMLSIARRRFMHLRPLA